MAEASRNSSEQTTQHTATTRRRDIERGILLKKWRMHTEAVVGTEFPKIDVIS